MAWWDAVKQLSQVTSQARGSLLQAARSQLGAEGQRDFDLSNPASCRRFGLMTVDELRQLAAGMTIGAHTLSHPLLSQTPPEVAREEIFGSKAALESALQKRVWALAYPFGDPQSVTPQVLAMAREAGFAAAFLNYGGGLGTALPYDSLPRIHVTAGMSLSEFDAHVSGFYARLHRMGRGSMNSSVIQDHAANG
jgi:peptidoglycan/xylan/chitin deacetylase (PgdA/CDA1 family)